MAGRLLFVWGSAYPLGGLSTWLDYLLPALSERGWSPVLGLASGPRHHRPERYLAEHPYEPWLEIPCRTSTPEGRCRALVGALREVDPDVVVGVNVADTYRAAGRLRRRGRGPRTVMTIHGIEPGLYADVRRFRDLLDGVAGTNRLACRLARDVGTMEEDRVHYAPYGLETPDAPPPRREPDGVLRIGWIGRLERPQKRVLDLPEISAALERRGVVHRLVVAGGGPEEARLRAALDDDRSDLLGVVPADEVGGTVLASIDALLITSAWETGPLVAWEAMAAGVPVVSSRYVGSGLEGALEEGENALLFETGDAEGAAGALGRLARDPGLAERLRRGGRRLVRERFHRDRSVDAWEACFEGVLAAPPRPPAPDPPVPRPGGRLEGVLGSKWAETVRSALGRTGVDAGPGGEWPHAYGGATPLEELLERAARIDRGEAT